MAVVAGLIDGAGVEGWGAPATIEGGGITDAGVTAYPVASAYELTAGGSQFSSVVRNTIGWDWLLRQWPASVPRYYGGLIAEEQRQNIVRGSNDLTNAGIWSVDSGAIRIADGTGNAPLVYGPDGKRLAFEFYNSSAGYSRVRQGAVTIASGQPVIVSGYFKKGTGNRIILELDTSSAGGGRHYVQVDLDILALIGGSGTFEKWGWLTLPEDWFVFWFRFTADATSGLPYYGVDHGSGETIFMLQMDVQEGQLPCTPIITGASALTRDADLIQDSASIPTTGWAAERADMILPAEGGASTRFLSLNSGDNDFIDFGDFANGGYVLEPFVGGVGQGNITGGTTSAGTHNMETEWGADFISFAVDGTQIGQSSPVSVPVMNVAHFGMSRLSGRHCNNTIPLALINSAQVNINPSFSGPG